MNTREQFWSAVDADLDARRDPLANTEVRAWMRAHEEDALALADLCSGLELVARVPEAQLVSPTVSTHASPHARARRTLVPLAAAALLASVALAAWLVLRSRQIAAPTLTAAEELMLHPVMPAPELGSVQAWEISNRLETPLHVQTVAVRRGELTIEDDYRAGPGLSDGVLAQDSVLATHDESRTPR